MLSIAIFYVLAIYAQGKEKSINMYLKIFEISQAIYIYISIRIKSSDKWTKLKTELKVSVKFVQCVRV